MFCHNCGVSCPKIAKFCHQCGTKLITAPPASFEPAKIETSAPSVNPEPAAPEDTSEMVASEIVGPNEPAAPQVDSPVEAQSPSDAENATQEQAIPSSPDVPAETQDLSQLELTPPAFPEEPPYSLPDQFPVPPVTSKRGSHWIPIVIMIILSALGLALFYAIPSNAPVPSDSDTPWFRNEDGTLYFDERLYDGPAELVIPDKVDGQTVTSLGDSCFAGCDWLTTAVLPESLVAIQEKAFSDCEALRGIYLPESVALIGEEAFSDCSDLEAIYISCPEVVIESEAFEGCDGLKYIMFNGTYQNWIRLYTDFIGPETEVHCIDGTFPQWYPFP